MLTKLKQLFSAAEQFDSDEMLADEQLAVVALMIEIISIDDVEHQHEMQMLSTLLTRQFGVTAEQLAVLVQQAKQAHAKATDFYRFTSVINRRYDAEQKIQLIESLWRLAWADKSLDDLEEHVIRRLASLLYVSHKDFIAAKLRVMQG